MMTREQYLLTCLAEECAEVVQRATKGIRFGLDPHPGRPPEYQDKNNREGLQHELSDLLTVADMLGLKLETSGAKRAQVLEFMDVSRDLGILEGEEFEFRRASASSICSKCQKPYLDHPWGGPLGMDDRQFLRRLCNGDLVKL